MVSRLFGKLDAQRHLISGAAWANAGAAPAARIPAIPAPAVLMNFLRCIWFSSGSCSGVPAKKTTSFPRDGHAVDEDRAADLGAARELVAADRLDAGEHVEQVARDGDFLHRVA